MENGSNISEYDEKFKVKLELWKYFTDDSAKIKDRMWTISSWMFSVQAGLLTFVANKLPADTQQSVGTNYSVIAGATVVGILLGLFTIIMIFQYGNHIRGMWNRADMIRRELPGLSDIWFLKSKKLIDLDGKFAVTPKKGLPGVAKLLIYLSFGFTTAFITLFIIVKY